MHLHSTDVSGCFAPFSFTVLSITPSDLQTAIPFLLSGLVLALLCLFSALLPLSALQLCPFTPAIPVSQKAAHSFLVMGSTIDDYLCPLCDRRNGPGYSPDGVDVPVCTLGRYSCLWFHFVLLKRRDRAAVQPGPCPRLDERAEDVEGVNLLGPLGVLVGARKLQPGVELPARCRALARARIGIRIASFL